MKNELILLGELKDWINSNDVRWDTAETVEACIDLLEEAKLDTNIDVAEWAEEL